MSAWLVHLGVVFFFPLREEDTDLLSCGRFLICRRPCSEFPLRAGLTRRCVQVARVLPSVLIVIPGLSVAEMYLRGDKDEDCIFSYDGLLHLLIFFSVRFRHYSGGSRLIG